VQQTRTETGRHWDRQTDRQTDRHWDRDRDRQTDNLLACSPACCPSHIRANTRSTSLIYPSSFWLMSSNSSSASLTAAGPAAGFSSSSSVICTQRQHTVLVAVAALPSSRSCCNILTCAHKLTEYQLSLPHTDLSLYDSQLKTVYAYYYLRKSRLTYKSLTIQAAKVIIVPHQIIWSWYTSCWWVSCYHFGTARRGPPRPLLAVPNATAHASVANVPITILLHNGPLLCGVH